MEKDSLDFKHRQWDVIIIGAGPAGLTAGYLLTKKSDLSTLILESNPTYVGGISRTENYKGYLFDIGGHRFFSKSRVVEDLWTELLPDDLLVCQRVSRIFYNRKFYNYPLQAFEALGNLGIFESILCLLSYLKARLRPTKEPRTFHEWVANQFGERLFQIFFKSYTEKVWGLGCDELSADWAAQRIKGLNLFSAVKSALQNSLNASGIISKNDRGAPKTLIKTFRYPRRGPGMMWESAKDQIIERNGHVYMGSSVVSLLWKKAEEIWEVTTCDAQGEKATYRSRHLISTAPLREIISAITPTPKSAENIKDLSYRDFIVVAVMLNKEPLFQDNWIYIHEPSVKVGRIQNFGAWSLDMVPKHGKGCLGLEYFCSEGDSLASMSDQSLIDLAITELQTLGLVNKTQVIDAKVVRQPKAYPVYDSSYKNIVESMKHEFINEYKNIHFIGRNGMHRYNNQDHAMMTAILTVENILSGKLMYDVWHVNEDAEYHEDVSSQKSNK